MDANSIQVVAAVASAIAAIASAIVAVIAIVAQRSQSRRSVAPLPFIVLNDYDGDLSVVLRNLGVGALKIKELKVKDSVSSDIKENIIEFMPELPPYLAWNTFVGSELEGRPIAANGEIVLVRFGAPLGQNPSVPALYRAIRTALSRLTMTVVTEDIYGHEQRTERAFTWFARTLVS